jgi:hypothetical protein
MKSPVFEANTIGLTTGTYKLPCGCAIYVYFPAGAIHLDRGQCPVLAEMWRRYQKLCRNDHNWDSLTLYIEMLQHVGTWEGRIKKIQKMRAQYPNPADLQDHPTTVDLTKKRKEENASVAA